MRRLLSQRASDSPPDAIKIQPRHIFRLQFTNQRMQQNRFYSDTATNANNFCYTVSLLYSKGKPLLIGSNTSFTPTPTPTRCQGSLYTIKSNDTCHSVSQSQGISTARLLSQNGMFSCKNFPKSGSLCIPKEVKCNTYTVIQGDNCGKIADAKGLTWTQVMNWNPDLGMACEGLKDAVGNEICISAPGGNWVDPSPQPPKTTSTLT